MKALWFTNTPAGGEEYLGKKSYGGGWIKSLGKAIKDKVDLHIAFYYSKQTSSFEYHGIHYYPMKYKSYTRRIIKNLLNISLMDDEDLPVYLEIISKINPEIIHLHGTENSFGCIIGKVEVPVVVSIQGIMNVIAHKYYSGIEKEYNTFQRRASNNMVSSFLPNSLKKEYKVSKRAAKREIKYLRQCKFIIGRTDWDRRVTSILVPAAKYFHNDEILRDSFYYNIWQPKKRDKLIIHSITSDASYKGFETICMALNELNELLISVEWRIAGIDLNSLTVKCTRKKLKNDFPSKGLVLMGNMVEREIVDSMLDADIFVMPSHIENSPNSLQEGLLLGMPCISTLVGGTGSLVNNGEDGLLIPEGDPWVLAGAILELLRNPEQATMLGKMARENALKRQDIDKIVSELISIYEEVSGLDE